jgi:hypothetical protein
LTMAAASGCSSTLAPGECRDGHDYLGRGPTVLLQGDCIVVGSDLQCHIDRNEGGYCAGPKRDVTTLARWVSTDSSVGVFTTPGFFQARSNGATAIYAELDDLIRRSRSRISFSLAKPHGKSAVLTSLSGKRRPAVSCVGQPSNSFPNPDPNKSVRQDWPRPGRPAGSGAISALRSSGPRRPDT